MHYFQDKSEIQLGDEVIVEGNVPGRVICDYEKQVCLEGYESWLSDKELVGGGTLSTGVMIKTSELGFLHYPEEDEDIKKGALEPGAEHR